MTQRYNPYAPNKKKAKYRVVEEDGHYYAQYKFLWFWFYFKTLVPCSSDVITAPESFESYEAAAAYIRNAISEKFSNKTGSEGQKILGYFDDTGCEF